MEKFLLAVLSLIVWPVGIILYFTQRQKHPEDAKLYLILGVIGAIFSGGALLG